MCLIAFDLNSLLNYGVDSSHPAGRANATRSTSIPQLSKSKSAPTLRYAQGRLGADRRKVMRARKRSSAGDF